MHKFIRAATRRTVGMAAGVILTGGLVGGVLLAPGTAYAAEATTTTMTATAQGSAIDVTVSVALTGATGTVTGPVSVSDGAGGSCHFFVNGSGGCDITNVPAGTYTVTATYEGFGDFGSSSASQSGVTVAGTPAPTPAVTSAPVWVADSPPLTATVGQAYGYSFHATGSPAPSYALSGAPGWLTINSYTGSVWGTVPNWTRSFSYSVVASNGIGTAATAGPFYVNVRPGYGYSYGYVNIYTSLYCTRYVFTGQRGYCTLTVANWGRNVAPDVTAQIVLPWQLKAGYTGYFYGYGIYGNTVSENLGTLYPGQTKELYVTFTARAGFNLWGRHPGHQFTVKVTGSASSSGNYGNFWLYGQRQSYSVAYVTIIPRGFWW
jgi:hypothetical protein